jgi:hypothetical protein
MALKPTIHTVSFMPDVCLTPAPPSSPIPIPYPNMAMSQDTSQGSKTVTCDGNPIMLQGSCFSKSTGDEARLDLTRVEPSVVRFATEATATSLGPRSAFDAQT